VQGRPSKAVSDALRWEIEHGRVRRLGRGRYGPAYIPRSTDYRIHQRVLALRAAVVAQRWAKVRRLVGHTQVAGVTKSYRRFMSSKHTLFRIFYRLGFTPWDGHPLAQSLRKLVEGNGALSAGKALELGCGTGECSIYLAEHGWQVTAVDYVTQALDKARVKADAAGAVVDFARADVTRLSSAGLGDDFGLIVDNGCLHNMSDADRDAYVREVGAVAAPDARLLIVAFAPGGRFGVRGVDPAEMERRFNQGWTMLSAGAEQELDRERTPTRYYLFQHESP